ncbi:MAG: hypothetical protein O6933_05415, partial [Planctomycetota bacterium]|nr:hypothetical protein [Planctomycetota bacterium]
MSSLLARIMLALLMLPLAALIYWVVIVGLMELAFGFGNDLAGFIITVMVSDAFVATYCSCCGNGLSDGHAGGSA